MEPNNAYKNYLILTKQWKLKFLAINEYIRKEESSQIDHLNFDLNSNSSKIFIKFTRETKLSCYGLNCPAEIHILKS